MSLLDLLKRFGRALLAFFGVGGVAASGPQDALVEELREKLRRTELAYATDGERYLARIEELERERDDLLADLGTCSNPGDVLHRWNERVRRRAGAAPPERTDPFGSG